MKKAQEPSFEISYQCMEALKTERSVRTSSQLQCILELTAQMKEFKDLPPIVAMELCRNVRYERMKASTIVFNIGDKADAYYFILRGEVFVKIRENFGDPLVTVATLKTGQSFGELALVNDKPRSATIETKIECEFLKIMKDDYVVLKARHEKDQQEKIASLQNYEVLRLLPRTNLAQLSDIIALTSFSTNKVLVKQGQKPETVFFIKKGKVMVVKELNVAPKKKPPCYRLLHLAELSEIDYFGEHGLLVQECEGRNPYSCIALGSVQCYLLSKVDFMRLVTGGSLELIRKYAKLFPDDQQIIDEFHRRKKWEEFKNNTVEQVVDENNKIKGLKYFSLLK